MSGSLIITEAAVILRLADPENIGEIRFSLPVQLEPRESSIMLRTLNIEDGTSGAPAAMLSAEREGVVLHYWKAGEDIDTTEGTRVLLGGFAYGPDQDDQGNEQDRGQDNAGGIAVADHYAVNILPVCDEPAGCAGGKREMPGVEGGGPG